MRKSWRDWMDGDWRLDMQHATCHMPTAFLDAFTAFTMAIPSAPSRGENNPYGSPGRQRWTGFRSQKILLASFAIVLYVWLVVQVPDETISATSRDSAVGGSEVSTWRDLPILEETDAKKIPVSLSDRVSNIEYAKSKYFMSLETRNKWLDQVGKVKGNELNKQIPNLDHVEIDNTIASADACKIGTPGRTLKVVDLNAERGIYWSEFAEMIDRDPRLSNPDILILNEMDIGMARSRNVHTTRNLAFRLGMNYAWGLEYVELTNGNQEETEATAGMTNDMGLHGNAILSSCPIFDPILVRDDLEEVFFSDKKVKKNAMGFERRLGGRMGMFVRTGKVDLEKNSVTALSLPHVIAGSVHKVQPLTHRERLWQYFGFGAFPDGLGKDKSPPPGQAPNYVLGIAMAGDLESRQFCPHAGLRNLDKPQKHKTFPSDCPTKRLGNWRGDQFCGNMEVAGEDISLLPCYIGPTDPTNSTGLQISDHAILQIELKTTLT